MAWAVAPGIPSHCTSRCCRASDGPDSSNTGGLHNYLTGPRRKAGTACSLGLGRGVLVGSAGFRERRMTTAGGGRDDDDGVPGFAESRQGRRRGINGGGTRGGRGPFSALASPKVDSARTDDGVGSDGIHGPGGLLVGGARALDAAGQARSGDGMAGCSEDGGSLQAVRTYL